MATWHPVLLLKMNWGGRGSGQELLTYVENDERTSRSSFSATSLTATWHCAVRAHLLAGADDVLAVLGGAVLLWEVVGCLRGGW